ncbi:MAG: transferrin-binding protein-like solute binding protein, partial [Desulfobulbaceae bacterium]|nr:transferrin-binding protein-like solute binding protein [Desulfobulbaceae bacterium]
NLADINGGGNISGAINLSDGLALSFTSLALASGNFSTNTVAGATSGQINGAFFGPNANATAGNFTADVTTAKYIGVFGANR